MTLEFKQRLIKNYEEQIGILTENVLILENSKHVVMEWQELKKLQEELNIIKLTPTIN